jgi:hypothetical protein
MKKTLLKAFFIYAFTNLQAQDITTGLVFHLDCNSTTSISDRSGSGTTGTATGTITSVAGFDGTSNTAFAFDGSSHINFSAAEITDLPLGDVGTSGRAYSLWVKLVDDQNRGAIFAYGAQLAKQHVHLNVNQANENQLNLGFWQTETTQAATSIVDISDENWHHIAINITQNSGGGYTGQYYIDNVLVATTNYTGTNVVDTTIPDDGGNTELRIGGRNDFGGSNLEFTGSLDDIRFYSRTLDTDDIEALYSDIDSSTTLSTSTLEAIADFKVYPTVTSDILTIETTADLNEISIISVNGMVVKKIEATNKVNVSSLSNGLYFLIGKSDTGIGTSRFIKK